jgi:hypothetical protein
VEKVVRVGTRAIPEKLWPLRTTDSFGYAQDRLFDSGGKNAASAEDDTPYGWYKLPADLAA